MTLQVRDNVREITGLLSIVSLALVFGAVLGYVPEAALPRFEGAIDVIPHVNVAISAAAILTILVGVRAIRNGNVGRHRAAMVSSAALFGVFLVLYLYRISLEGPSAFPGPETVRQFVYLPILAVHILLAIVCVPLVYYVLLLAGTHTLPELPDTGHARVGRFAAAFWLVSFAFGITIWFMLYVLF